MLTLHWKLSKFNKITIHCQLQNITDNFDSHFSCVCVGLMVVFMSYPSKFYFIIPFAWQKMVGKFKFYSSQLSLAEFLLIHQLFLLGGKYVTSPKNKIQPKLKSFHEEKSPKSRMINGQSTESLESLSDELASNSGGNNSTNEVTNNRRGRVS